MIMPQPQAPKRPSIPEQIRALQLWLRDNKGGLPISKLQDVVVYLRKYATKLLPENDIAMLRTEVCEAFGITAAELDDSMKAPVTKVVPKDDFMEFVPKKGWFYDYIQYTMYSESPTAFHFWCALGVVGACLKRNVWIDQGLWKVYPNMAIFIIGPSTKVRKTTAADIATNIGLRTSGLRLLAERITPEALISVLAEGDEATGLIYVPELAATFTRQKYNEALIPLLTRLWDCPDTMPTATISRSHQVLFNVAVSLIACSNDTWLANIPDSAFGGGFMARIIQVYQESSPRRYSRPKKPPTHLAESLGDRLEEAQFIKGEIDLTKAGEAWYDKRYKEIMDTIPDDERLAPFYGRVPDHMLRIAMILRIAENDFQDRTDTDRIFLDIEHLQQADAMLRWVLKYLPKVYAPLGASPAGEEGEKILRYMKANGGKATRPEIARFTRSRLQRRQLDEVLGTLLDAGDITPASSGLWVGYETVKRK